MIGSKGINIFKSGDYVYVCPCLSLGTMCIRVHVLILITPNSDVS